MKINKIAILMMSMILSLVFGVAAEFIQQETQSKVVFDYTWFYQELRMSYIQRLIDMGFDRFETKPFGPWNHNIILSWIDIDWYPDYQVNYTIQDLDDLDLLISQKLQKISLNHSIGYRLPDISDIWLNLTSQDIDWLDKVYFFKTSQDLKDLWYIVSSYRTRTNTDEPWRQDNIMISYRNIWNTRVLNTDQVLSFMQEIRYDPQVKDWKKDLASWRANIWWLVKVRWWWICGAAWWINALVRPNRAVEVIDWKPHTRTYKSLYKNEINWEESWIPWLDIAVYSFSRATQDFKIKNIRPYPIILTMNYDGSEWWQEELFILSRLQDRGYLRYIWKKSNCYTREANQQQFTSCYWTVLW